MNDLKFTTAGDFLKAQETRRIGFACKYMHPNQNQPKKILEELQRPLNEKATTITWLNNQTREVAEQRLWDIMEHNGAAALRLVEYVGGLPNALRMVRLGSNQLPAYTQPDWSYFWRKSDVRQRAETLYKRVGETARSLDVRMSMHPGQFTVLASDNPDIVNRSIEEFEYHADIIRYMGYGQNWQDFKCNVHISGRQGPEGIKDILPRLSPEARNCITIENDENSWGLDASLELEKHVALVIDIHHHWVKTGEYIEPNDDRVKRIRDSWRGVRPSMHYSISKETYITEHRHDTRPSMEDLLQQGYKKAKLRAHSDMCWNRACNNWALSFWDDFDIMVEAKHKNLASAQLYKQYLQLAHNQH
jgi:UV DNA damage repair endonuclease